MPSISLVMVVRDEASTLEQAVTSVREVVDQVVIGIDDACTDDTPEIARSLADTPFDFTWENSFAKARNLALDRAESQYILVLDGHEFVPDDDHPAPRQLARMRKVDPNELLTPLCFLEQIKENGLPEAFKVGCLHLLMNTDFAGIPGLFFIQPRIFRNNGEVRYESAVHNHLIGYKNTEALGCPEGVIIHNMPPEREAKRKVQRKKMNFSGLMKDIRQERHLPIEEQAARPYFYMGNSHADLGHAGKAIYWYEQYLKRSKFSEEKYQALQQLGVLYYRHAKDEQKARLTAAEALITQYRRAEPYILLGEMAFEGKDYQQALHWFGLAAQIPAPTVVMFLQGPVYSYMPLLKIMLVYEEMGDWHNALAMAEEVLSWRPGDGNIIEKIDLYKRRLRTCEEDPDRNLLMVDAIGSFTEEIGKRLAGQFNVARRAACDERWRGWADVAWFEWCDKNLVEWSFKEWHGPLICRLHSYEAFGDIPAHVNWDNVDHLTFVAEHIRDLFLQKWPAVAEMTEISVIPNGISPEELTFEERGHGPRIGYLGYLNHKKGVALLLQAIRALPEYEFHIAGQFQDPHLAYYFQGAVEELHNVTYHGWVPAEKKDAWLEGIDYLISPSVVESFGYSIAEAMVKGIKPLVHHRQGAVWHETWRTVDELRALVHPTSEYSSQDYRDHILDNFSLEGQMTAIEDLLARLSGAHRAKLPAHYEKLQEHMAV
ncbi:MAG: glycosyltransferase [Verrucomicrobia bacterium]|nr:glycosyltransferase [Verrucomicrobiota bacterium]